MLLAAYYPKRVMYKLFPLQSTTDLAHRLKDGAAGGIRLLVRNVLTTEDVKVL